MSSSPFPQKPPTDGTTNESHVEGDTTIEPAPPPTPGRSQKELMEEKGLAQTLVITPMGFYYTFQTAFTAVCLSRAHIRGCAVRNFMLVMVFFVYVSRISMLIYYAEMYATASNALDRETSGERQSQRNHSFRRATR